MILKSKLRDHQAKSKMQFLSSHQVLLLNQQEKILKIDLKSLMLDLHQHPNHSSKQ